MSYNGIECALRVLDNETKKWVPFTIDGKEINSFPSKELVEIIYRYRNLNHIIITEHYDSINISTIIQQLKEIYRNIPHIQNDNQRTMDFTIAFIALKSILEKHGSELGKNWSDLRVSEQKKLKELIKIYVEDIVDDLEIAYGEIFKIRADPKGKIKEFDFLGTINQFPNNVDEKGHLVKIFETLDQLPHLHSSKFDPFAEVYQSLMDKHTRKIFGQFFTPRHIIKTLVRLFYEGEVETLVGDIIKGKADRPKSICDPACGTGGFLTESFKYLASNITDIDVKDLAKKAVYGFDIYPANTARSRINMYLAGDGFSRIDPLDSLKELDDESNRFDYILTNPPFGKGDYIVDSGIMSNKRKEVNFLIKVIRLLKPQGKALIIVPDGILEAPTLSPLRKWLIENCAIEKIIGFPKHEFAPYTHEKTYALFLKKRPLQIMDLDEVKTERVWMYIIDTDGYANSDKRFRTGKKDNDGKWLHDELSLWRDMKGAFHVSILEDNWKKKIPNQDEQYTNEWDVKIEGSKFGYVDMDAIFKEKHTSFEILNKTKILKLLKDEEITDLPKTPQDLFETMETDEDEQEESEEQYKVLKPNYEKVLTAKGITYDYFEDKFYDENSLVIKQLLNLDPLGYLRPKQNVTVSFEQFSEENKKLLEEIDGELVQIHEELRQITH
jgi:type I restriction-modification system DNA methylase subunit